MAGPGLSVHGGKTGFPGSVGAADGPLPWIFSPLGKRLEFTSELDRRPVLSQTMQNQPIRDVMIL